MNNLKNLIVPPIISNIIFIIITLVSVLLSHWVSNNFLVRKSKETKIEKIDDDKELSEKNGKKSKVELLIQMAVFLFFLVVFYLLYEYSPIPEKIKNNGDNYIQTKIHFSKKYKKDFSNIKEKMIVLKSRFEEISAKNLLTGNFSSQENNSLNDIRQISQEVIDTLSNIKDDSLTWGYRALKYNDLSYIYAIYAEIEQDTLKKTENILTCLNNVNIALNIYHLASLMVKFNESKYYNYNFKDLINKWFKNKKKKYPYYQLLFIKSWMFALQQRIKIKKNSCYIAKYFWDKIDKNYRDRWKTSGNPSLYYCDSLCWKNK